ncbi:MAG: hypothetical protein EA412_01685 [Chitinophagaceae bacterium]|nr:MAG: hypothetical protein EA412_01685 [Chitinophagaceae bacterium]
MTNLNVFLLILFVLIFGQSGLYAQQQGISINSDGTFSHASSILDVESTEKGFLFPRMTEQQRDDIQGPEQSLWTFNTDCNCLQIFIDGYRQNVNCAP